MRTTLFFLIFAATPSEPLSSGLQALQQGDAATALPWLDAAAGTTADPGLVAFNRGVALWQLGRPREAEVQFERCLDDAAIPQSRRAQALYNRGVCLLARDDLPALRLAMDCLTLSRDAAAAELKADAEHNLEIAKLRWQRARLQPPEPPARSESGLENASKNDAGTGTSDESMNAKQAMTPATGPAGANDRAASGLPRPGAGSLPVLRDDAILMPLSPDDTRSYLEQAARRLATQRHAIEAMRRGPERRGVRDW